MTELWVPQRVRSWLQEIFGAMGASPAAADAVADSLWEAELCGHESHGLLRVPEYSEQVASGDLDPRSEPQVIAENATQLHLDCRQAFGAYAGQRLTDSLLEKARTHGVAAGALRHAGHVGRAGDYPARLAAQGMFALALVNGGGKTPRVAPHGGAQAFLGTNPVALAVPGPMAEGPIVVDFSTAAVASGKIRLWKELQQELPAGLILDAHGHPSRNADDYYAGGMLLPAAAHKGYGLSLVADVVAGLVSGTGYPGAGAGFSGANGFFMMACDLELFLPGEQLRAAVTAWAKDLRRVPPRESGGAIKLAGEVEANLRERRLREGLPIAESLRRRLAEVSARWGVSPL